MIGGIESHVPRRRRSRHVLDDVVLVGRVLVNHRERAVGIRRERVA